MQRSTWRDDLVLVFLMGIWGFNYLLTKIGVSELDLMVVAMVRNMTTLVALFAAFLLLERRWPGRPVHPLRLALIGLTGITANQILYTASLRYTSTTNASLLSGMTPVFGLILARLMQGEHTSAKRWLGVAISIVGVGLIVGGGKAGFSFGSEGFVGDASMLAAAVTFALFGLLARPVLKVYSPLEALLFGYLFGVPMLLPLSAPAILAQDWPAVTLVGWGGAIGVGLNSVIVNLLFYRQIGRVGAPRVMVFMYLAPISGAVMAMLFLQETITVFQMVGAAVVLLGVDTARRG